MSLVLGPCPASLPALPPVAVWPQTGIYGRAGLPHCPESVPPRKNACGPAPRSRETAGWCGHDARATRAVLGPLPR